MGKEDDGTLTPAEASAVLKAEQADKGYLNYMQQSEEEVSAGVMSISLHSYHGLREAVCDEQYSKPPGFEVRHLHLDKEDVDEMIRAYKTAASVFHKVDMKIVYAVATGSDDDTLPMMKEQIQPWIGKQIFAIAPPGSKKPLLYTPASASMKRWGDPAVLTNDEKMNRVLVPLIPLDARIKMTMVEQN